MENCRIVLVLSKLKKYPQPHRTDFKYFEIFKNVAHSLKPGETPEYIGVSPGFKLCTTFLNIAKHDEIMTRIQFTGTITQPHRNRKFRQFNNDQYCSSRGELKLITYNQGSR